MMAAFAQAGSDKSASMTGASLGSMRTGLMFGRMNAPDAGPPLGLGLAAASITPDGSGWDGGAMRAGEAASALFANTQNTTLGAIAPHAFLLRTPAPYVSSLFL